MPFNAPASVPQITYASYPPPPNSLYCSPMHSALSPPPTQRDIFTNRRLNQRFVSIKAALLTMLRTRQLPNLPWGFPFQCIPAAPGMVDGVDLALWDAHLSYSSYEFFEYVTFDPMSAPCCAIFSYTAPAYHCDPAMSGVSSKMTWRIKIPSQGTTFLNEARSFVTVSQVELDPALMETPFGFEFMTDGHMLLEALSVSLEHGLHLTVQLALSTTYPENCRDIYKSRNRDRLRYRSGDLVFVSKKNDGRREVVHVYQGTVPRKT